LKILCFFRECHGFRLIKWVAYFWVDFDHFWTKKFIFRGIWDNIENWLEHKTKPPSRNLACPKLWNTLYMRPSLMEVRYFWNWILGSLYFVSLRSEFRFTNFKGSLYITKLCNFIALQRLDKLVIMLTISS